MTLFGIACATLVAVVFGFAVVGKLRDRASWTDFVATTAAMVPTRRIPAGPVAVLVVAAELATSLLTVAAVLTRDTTVELLAFALAGVLLMGFAAGIAGVLRRGLSVRCNCFGAGGAVFGATHLARNASLLLIVAAGLVASLTGRPESLDAAALVAITAGAIAGLLAAHWDELAFLVRGPRKA
jgi:hypothetical protein